MKNVVLILFLFLMSCSDKSKQVSEIKDPLLFKKAMEQGNEIATLAQQTLGSQLMRQVTQNGTTEAVTFCNLAAYPILDTLKTGLNVSIKRASIKARNINDLPTDYEKIIIEKYENDYSNKQPLIPVVRALGDEEVLYAAPISIKNGLCLKCHGSEISDIDVATLNKIQNLYPKDKATGHKMGDLRGIWSIRFSRSQLIDFEMGK